MTREEFNVLAKAMNAFFPSMHILTDIDTMNAWYAMIGDIDYQTASMALRAHVNTSPYEPKVVDFRKFANHQKTDGLNEEEAWALVIRAIRNGTYGSEEEYAKLPPLVQKAVGSPVNIEAWAQLSSDEVHTVVASNFMRLYRAEAEKAKNKVLLDDSLKLTEKDRELLEGE